MRKIFLVSLLALAACGQRVSYPDLATALPISDVVYEHAPDRANPGFEHGEVTFSVANATSQPIVAYRVRISSDSNVRTRLFPRRSGEDFTNLIEGNPGAEQSVLLKPGQSRSGHDGFTAPTEMLPDGVVITPLYVVLADGTLIGDRAIAMSSFYDAQKAVAVVYREFLAEAKAIDGLPPEQSLAALVKLWSSHPRPSTLSIVNPTSPVDMGEYRAREQNWGLMVSLGQFQTDYGRAPREALAQMVAQRVNMITAVTQRRLDVALKYSDPR